MVRIIELWSNTVALLNLNGWTITSKWINFEEWSPSIYISTTTRLVNKQHIGKMGDNIRMKLGLYTTGPVKQLTDLRFFSPQALTDPYKPGNQLKYFNPWIPTEWMPLSSILITYLFSNAKRQVTTLSLHAFTLANALHTLLNTSRLPKLLQASIFFHSGYQARPMTRQNWVFHFPPLRESEMSEWPPNSLLRGSFMPVSTFEVLEDRI